VSFDAPHLPLIKIKDSTLLYSSTVTAPYTNTSYDRLGFPSESSVTLRSSKIYTFASAATNEFTEPISLEGAKSVWVSLVSVEAAELWTIDYTGGSPVVDSETNWSRLQPSKATANSAFGFDVVDPSADGAGFIGGGNLPPYLTVKLKGATATVITMHITY
jgi:hypothetical protein